MWGGGSVLNTSYASDTCRSPLYFVFARDSHSMEPVPSRAMSLDLGLRICEHSPSVGPDLVHVCPGAMWKGFLVRLQCLAILSYAPSQRKGGRL